MTKVRIIFSVLTVFLLMSPLAYAISGREVFEKVQSLRNKKLDQKAEATMVLFDKGGGKRTRTLSMFGKDAAPEAYKVLIVFNSPPDLKDVGFLIHAHSAADRDLWAYFPEFKRIRRIPTASQDDSFFGSDFSYDDFSGPPDLNEYVYKIIREDEVIDNRPCYVIEVTPKKPRKYSKYIIWVAKNIWVPTKIEYYREKELYRAGAFKDIRTIDGIPTPFMYEMENLKTRHRTVLTIQSISYTTKYPDSLFTQRSLERGAK